MRPTKLWHESSAWFLSSSRPRVRGSTSESRTRAFGDDVNHALDSESRTRSPTTGIIPRGHVPCLAGVRGRLLARVLDPFTPVLIRYVLPARKPCGHCTSALAEDSYHGFRVGEMHSQRAACVAFSVSATSVQVLASGLRKKERLWRFIA